MGHDAPVVVAVDFGTTFSGCAYARASEPNDIFKFYDWPCAGRAGAKPYCKTQTSLLYASVANHDHDHSLQFELRDWGWSGLVQVMQGYKSAANKPQAQKTHHPSNSAPAAFHGLSLLYHAENSDGKHLDVFTMPGKSTTEKMGFFASKFKLYLAPDAGASSQDLLGDITVERMVVDYLRCLSDFIITELQKTYGKHFGKEDVQWCLTVPAIWDDQAKQVMKVFAEKAGMVKGAGCPKGMAASPFPLDIILEPEAASVYCQKRAKHLNLKKGAKLLVADVGGGTIDLVVHEKAEEDSESMMVHEAVSSYGDVGGGTFVDANFFRFLSQKIGCFKEVCQKDSSVFLKLYEWWQGVKVGFDGEGYFAEMPVPRKLREAWERYDKDLGIQCTEDEHHYEEVILNDTDMMSIFNPEVEKVLYLIEKQIKGVYVLMLVGGFSASPYLVKRVRDRFEKRVAEVMIPEDPGSAICHGAVQLHTGIKDVIQSRLAKRTYGIQKQRSARPDDPPEHLYTNDDGKRMCRNCFDVFLQVGERVPLNKCIKTTYSPAKHGQREMSISLFYTKSGSAKHTSEVGVVKEGTFYVDMSENMELDKDRKVEVKMVFGASLIQVTATPLNFGKAGLEQKGLSVSFHKA